MYEIFNVVNTITVVEWLRADAVELPSGTPTSLFVTAKNSDHEESDDEGWDDDAEATEAKAHFDFGDFTDAVQRAIQRLGGAVLPKLNWSSPQDAVWMNMGSLRCSQAGDVFLLLKSSDFVVHDLELHRAGLAGPGVPLTLVLRRWHALRPERSFRCFVRKRRVVGISQRDTTAYYPQLAAEAPKIESTILAFLSSSGRAKTVAATSAKDADNVGDGRSGGGGGGGEAAVASVATTTVAASLLERYPDPNVVVDVYVDQDHKAWVVDFNVWAPVTDGLLFAWDSPPLATLPPLPPPEALTASTSAVAQRGPADALGAAQTLPMPGPTASSANGEIMPPGPAAASEAVKLPDADPAPDAAPTGVAASVSGPSGAPLLRLVGRDGARIRADTFADCRVPVEMQHFARGLAGAADEEAAAATKGIAEFVAFMREAEQAEAKKRDTEDGGPGAP